MSLQSFVLTVSLFPSNVHLVTLGDAFKVPAVKKDTVQSVTTIMAKPAEKNRSEVTEAM